MLVQFTVENFMSFKDETTFSMLAMGSDRQHPNHVVEDAAGKGQDVLRSAAIYGANAAGKSNLIQAIRFAQHLVIDGTRDSRRIPVVPFRLRDNVRRPSKFDFMFTYQGVLYSYGFKVNATQVLEEWLYATPNKQEVTYFERSTDENGKTVVEFGPALKERSRKQEQFLDFVAQGTRRNQLFLTEAVDRNVKAVAPVMEWFRKCLHIIAAESKSVHLEMNVHVNQNLTNFLSEFLRVAGTGIEDIATIEMPLDFDQHLPEMIEEDRQYILQFFANENTNAGLTIMSPSGKSFFIRLMEDRRLSLVQLKTQHRAEDGSLVDFEIEEESEGTQRLLHLIPALFLLRADADRVILLDELDRRLHPLLSRLFVEAALDCGAGNRQHQLIFTTHDTNLLDLELLRRDEIWFVEKDKQGASHAYSLAEFKIRPDLKVEQGYLNGRFGGIPFIGDICNLGWTAKENMAVEA